MGKLLLTLAFAAVALSACEPAEPGGGVAGGAPGDTAVVASDPHADLACRSCHQGPQADRGRASVPASSCTTSGCHEAGGPKEVQIATVTFPHRGHGQGSEIQLSCAGCHTHDAGSEPLRASVDACALCHVEQISASAQADCRLCHQQPDHSELTSQGVAVPHSELPWTDIGCVRCHYDVAEPQTEVSQAKCRTCHDDLEQLNATAVGRDLHPLHAGVNCTSCHASQMHHVRAMSSAVDLVCSDCHVEVHGVELEQEGWPPSRVCSGCHTGVHAAQQRLLLGISPDGTVEPSAKFLAGITCRSCHVPTDRSRRDPTVAIRGQATACAGCHQEQYEEVLGWWLQGLHTRLNESRSYLNTATQRLTSPSDSARSLLANARAMLDLVQRGGGQHNLELSDRLMREAVARTRQAYGQSGQTAPPTPDLGRVPHSGLCTYCHYRADDPWNFEAMPQDFHRSVLRPEEGQ